jgi:hypothetical protein
MAFEQRKKRLLRKRNVEIWVSMQTAEEARLLWMAAAEVEPTAAVAAAQRAAHTVMETLRPWQRRLNALLLPAAAAESVTPRVRTVRISWVRVRVRAGVSIHLG